MKKQLIRNEERKKVSNHKDEAIRANKSVSSSASAKKNAKERIRHNEKSKLLM